MSHDNLVDLLGNAVFGFVQTDIRNNISVCTQSRKSDLQKQEHRVSGIGIKPLNTSPIRWNPSSKLKQRKTLAIDTAPLV